ncbi:MAG: transglutaminase-like domain-containing protein [Methanobacteriota archaeon]
MTIPPIIQPGTITPYLACSPLITCTNPVIRVRARELIIGAHDECEQITNLYQYVRDEVAHSVDIGQSDLVWKPAQIISSGHALCIGKSLLLVALCRVIGIPAGLCYQRIKKGTGEYVLHGLSAIWFEEDERWIRLDARGNKPGIDARFNPHGEEQIAYPMIEDPGEWIDLHVYAEPWKEVIRLLKSSDDVMTFIKASSQIQAPPRHPHRNPVQIPVLV